LIYIFRKEEASIILKILIVDDESTICEGMKAFIEWNHYGYDTPDVAENGHKALSLLEQEQYDLVITDIRMPGKDGLELARAIRHKKLCCHVIIMSGYKDFEYAQKAIEYGVSKYLLKPLDEDKLIDIIVSIREIVNEEKRKRLEEQELISFIKKSLLQNLSSNINSNRENVRKFIAEQKIFLSNRYYTVFLLKNVYKRMSDLMSQLSDLRPIENLIVFKYNNTTIGMLYIHSAENADIDNFINDIEKLIKCLEEKLVLIVGSPVYGPENLTQALSMVSKLLKISFYYPDPKVLFCKDFKNSSLSPLPNDFSWGYDKLCHHIFECNEESALSEIEHLITIFTQNKVEIDLCMGIVTSLLLKILNMISSLSGDTSDIFGHYSDLGKYYTICDVNALNERLKVVCAKAISYLNKRKNAQTYTYMDNIRDYIEKNYYNDISIKTVADRFYMNPAYLGRKFKECYNIGMPDYINTCRIEQAKKLLSNVQVKMSSIYSQVGYSNPDTYYIQFKKITGMNPSEYKSLINY
jgi:two-component system, response regulator YesN